MRYIALQLIHDEIQRLNHEIMRNGDQSGIYRLKLIKCENAKNELEELFNKI